jgi:hypothetical protein
MQNECWPTPPWANWDFILVAIGWGTTLALMAAIVYAFNHSLLKAAMLMLAGSVASRAPVKTAAFSAITGLGKTVPWPGCCSCWEAWAWRASPHERIHQQTDVVQQRHPGTGLPASGSAGFGQHHHGRLYFQSFPEDLVGTATRKRSPEEIWRPVDRACYFDQPMPPAGAVGRAAAAVGCCNRGLDGAACRIYPGRTRRLGN